MAHPSNPDIKIIMIAAVDRNGALGRDGSLPWRCPVDMRHFVACTTDKLVVMGRVTADGFAKPLRNRMNVVMTRSGVYEREGFLACDGVESAVRLAEQQGVKELWVIGGGAVYEQWLAYTDIIHLTEIDVEVLDADVFFPIDGMEDFEGTSVTTVEDPLVRFWTLQRARVGTRRDMIAANATTVVMDLNEPTAFWVPGRGVVDFYDMLPDTSDT